MSVELEVVVQEHRAGLPMLGHLRLPGERAPLCGATALLAVYRRVRPTDQPSEACRACCEAAEAIATRSSAQA